jgi:TRAP-type mannitol/chloroaromatic compound transport system permease small subunit
VANNYSTPSTQQEPDNFYHPLFSGKIPLFACRFMSSFIKTSQLCISTINHINEWVGKTISWLTLLMVVITFIVVVLRYAFDIGWIALQESVLYMHAMVFMLGAAYTLRHDGHVRVDILYQRCSDKTRARIDCLGTLFLLMPVTGFIIWSSWEYVADSWTIKESSRNSGGLPGVYLLKTTILFMAGLLILQSIALFLQNLLIVLGINQENV